MTTEQRENIKKMVKAKRAPVNFIFTKIDK